MRLWRERAGVISAGPVWVLCYGCWMHLHPSLWGVLWQALTEYRHDRHTVG